MAILDARFLGSFSGNLSASWILWGRLWGAMMQEACVRAPSMILAPPENLHALELQSLCLELPLSPSARVISLPSTIDMRLVLKEDYSTVR